MSSFNSIRRCGIVLAGGRGLRLRPFIHRLKGSTLPKQYVNFTGTRSMLEHTCDRAERLISRDRLLTVVARDHLNYEEAEEQLSGRSAGTVIAQPEDRDTGPGILLPLMHLYKRHPDATVAVFPADHFILEEDVFMAHVGMAFYLVENDPSRLVVLGTEPGEPEPELGYSQPDGGAWHTMTLVFRADTVLDLVRTLIPRLYGQLQEVYRAIGTRKERPVLEDAYRRMKPMNFADEILNMFPLLRSSQLSVLPVSEVSWSDWDSERAVVNALTQTGYLNRLHGVADGRISAS
jgi:mannose-1-phosphate guanylyltransferase